MSESCRKTCRLPRLRSRESHCTVCHKTFSGPTWFDVHRIGGKCQDIAGMVEKDGLWATKERHQHNADSSERMRKMNEEEEAMP